jgi:hypothetical protein
MTQTTPKGQSRYTWRFEGVGAYRFAVEGSPDGERWQLFMEGLDRRA